jgi:carbon storage regulator
MLVLTRYIGERIYIGNDIQIVAVGVQGKQVRLGIMCPSDVEIMRAEVIEREPPPVNRTVAVISGSHKEFVRYTREKARGGAKVLTYAHKAVVGDTMYLDVNRADQLRGRKGPIEHEVVGSGYNCTELPAILNVLAAINGGLNGDG